MSKFVFVDMETGNLHSLENAFKRIGVEIVRATSPTDIADASVVVLPGVGAFGKAMEVLREKDLIDPLRQIVLSKRKPLLGICLGMQLLAENSDEHGFHNGLGLLKGSVRKLEPPTLEFRVPNIGWDDVNVDNTKELFTKNGTIRSYYFVHSYHLVCDDPNDVAGVINYGGEKVTAAIEKNNIFGLQFHPEKSQSAGLDLLNNFLKHMRKMGHVF